MPWPVLFGVLWMGWVTLWRTIANSNMAFRGSVEEREIDSAAGLMNFLRTHSGTFATSVVTTVWATAVPASHCSRRRRNITPPLRQPGNPAFTAELPAADGGWAAGSC